MNETKFFCAFFGMVFLAFGFGVTLEQYVDSVSGFLFLGVGFVLLIIFAILPTKLCVGLP